MAKKEREEKWAYKESGPQIPRMLYNPRQINDAEPVGLSLRFLRSRHVAMQRIAGHA